MRWYVDLCHSCLQRSTVSVNHCSSKTNISFNTQDVFLLIIVICCIVSDVDGVYQRSRPWIEESLTILSQKVLDLWWLPYIHINTHENTSQVSKCLWGYPDSEFSLSKSGSLLCLKFVARKSNSGHSVDNHVQYVSKKSYLSLIRPVVRSNVTLLRLVTSSVPDL